MSLKGQKQEEPLLWGQEQQRESRRSRREGRSRRESMSREESISRGKNQIKRSAGSGYSHRAGGASFMGAGTGERESRRSRRERAGERAAEAIRKFTSCKGRIQLKILVVFNRPGPKAGSIHSIEVSVCLFVCLFVCLLVPPHIFFRDGCPTLQYTWDPQYFYRFRTP